MDVELQNEIHRMRRDLLAAEAVIRVLLVWAEREELSQSSRIGYPVTLAEAAVGRDFLDTCPALDDHEDMASGVRDLAQMYNDNVPIFSGLLRSPQTHSEASLLLVKACRDIHVFGASASVVSGIVKALSDLDNVSLQAERTEKEDK